MNEGKIQNISMTKNINFIDNKANELEVNNSRHHISEGECSKASGEITKESITDLPSNTM